MHRDQPELVHPVGWTRWPPGPWVSPAGDDRFDGRSHALGAVVHAGRAASGRRDWRPGLHVPHGDRDDPGSSSVLPTVLCAGERGSVSEPAARPGDAAQVSHGDKQRGGCDAVRPTTLPRTPDVGVTSGIDWAGGDHAVAVVPTDRAEVGRGRRNHSRSGVSGTVFWLVSMFCSSHRSRWCLLRIRSRIAASTAAVIEPARTATLTRCGGCGAGVEGVWRRSRGCSGWSGGFRSSASAVGGRPRQNVSAASVAVGAMSSRRWLP